MIDQSLGCGDQSALGGGRGWVHGGVERRWLEEGMSESGKPSRQVPFRWNRHGQAVAGIGSSTVRHGLFPQIVRRIRVAITGEFLQVAVAELADFKGRMRQRRLGNVGSEKAV